jgi:mono/diheme cytochrome c family protein
MRKNLIVTLTLIAAVAILPMAAYADGAATYKAKCVACHGPDASKRFDNVKTLSEADVVKVVTDGKDAKPMKMPAYSGKLSAAEITEVAKYLKSVKK